MDPSSFALMPERDVRALLDDPSVSLRVLRPPYAALGVGALRVLRVRQRGSETEIVAGYERYERLSP